MTTIVVTPSVDPEEDIKWLIRDVTVSDYLSQYRPASQEDTDDNKWHLFNLFRARVQHYLARGIPHNQIPMEWVYNPYIDTPEIMVAVIQEVDDADTPGAEEDDDDDLQQLAEQLDQKLCDVGNTFVTFQIVQ